MFLNRSSGLQMFLLVFVFAPLLKDADAQQINVKSDPRYGALTWVQNSAEYALLTRQTYGLALVQLRIGMNDPKWSADEIQNAEGGFEDKPPAVILDCDETVLDNSVYNARNILHGKQYTTQAWNAWYSKNRQWPWACRQKQMAF